MTEYSGDAKCHCGSYHHFIGVTDKYNPHYAKFHHALVRYIKCERCMKIFFRTKFTERTKSGAFSIPERLYQDDPVCCEECQPIVKQRKLEIYDGITPGTTDVLTRLKNIENELQEIKNLRIETYNKMNDELQETYKNLQIETYNKMNDQLQRLKNIENDLRVSRKYSQYCIIMCILYISIRFIFLKTQYF